MFNIADVDQIIVGVTGFVDAFSTLGKKIVFANVLSLFGFTSQSLPLVVAILLLGSIFFTIRLGFVNIRYAVHGTKLLLQSGGKHDAVVDDKDEKISPIKALFVAIGGAAGLGNISGVAVAIAVGGPGAAFWMFITPLITMPLRFAEVFLSHKYRIVTKHGFDGGPCQYMKSAFAEHGFATFGIIMSFAYAIFMFLASFGGGCSFQMNQIVQVLSENISILNGRHFVLSLLLTCIAGIVIFGGIKRIANFISNIVPMMIAVYFISCLVVIIFNYQNIIPSLKLILSSAFSLNSAFGGALGAFTIGFTRIIIANETGLGTAGIIHSNSSNTVSAKEAMISMASPFIDTFFVCLMSALVVIVTDVYGMNYPGIIMTTKAFATVTPWFAYIVIAMVPFMGLNVLIAWSYYGLRNWQYIIGSNKFDMVYLIFYVLAAFCGGIVSDFDVIVRLTDVINTAIAIPNVIAAVLLSGTVALGLKQYSANKKKL